MEEMLSRFGYIKNIEYNEWQKENWTVRIMDGEIEGFNDPEEETPAYYAKVKANNVMLEMMLDSIDALLR